MARLMAMKRVRKTSECLLVRSGQHFGLIYLHFFREKNGSNSKCILWFLTSQTTVVNGRWFLYSCLCRSAKMVLAVLRSLGLEQFEGMSRLLENFIYDSIFPFGKSYMILIETVIY